jgi:mRNA deadenylase 3'-5' endonuclease subunit Ccr4
LDLHLRRKVVKCYIWSIVLYGAETWKLQGVDQKYMENFWNVVLEKDGEVGLIV